MIRVLSTSVPINTFHKNLFLSETDMSNKCFDFLSAMNGMMESSHSGSRSGAHHHHHHKPRNYKLVVDPFLVKGASKLYRYDGNIPNDPTYPPVQLRDPRKPPPRIWGRPDPLDIPLPRFKVRFTVFGLFTSGNDGLLQLILFYLMNVPFIYNIFFYRLMQIM